MKYWQGKMATTTFSYLVPSIQTHKKNCSLKKVKKKM